ncbi:PRC-barrel domain-containing protein [Pseudalkalibacillus caeni]|uniref:PRC-barrel domain containing protein n=1 Tax=Exobacillus caeni TaxID=2574798 RepID=A0A5R9F313_9BACL|nr:PRC-barrel domain-containing protein [Pseudalkalibacillus caeni]TLS38072.1 PRC-barrel domain containing protein [Pseudalkalibacillus caeni]
MLLSEKELHGFSIDTTDDELGEAKEFYFDDKDWTVRYAVIDTHKWLPGKKVLISPYSIEKIRREEQKLHVDLSTDQVKNSPEIDTEQPVSRQHEGELNNYYGWPYYWAGTGLWGATAYPRPAPAAEAFDRDERSPDEEEEIRERQDTHLRSTKEVSEYHIEATDDEFGHVDDFIIDDESWKIRYLVIDTKNWWFGKKVLVSPEWITDINWDQRVIKVDLDEETIKNGPEYNPNQPLSRRFEEDVHEHYGKQKYWEI